MTLYLVRHAQCMPTRALPFSDWPLSRLGLRQAEQLADLLDPLAIAHVFSSPFVRSLHTAHPFARRRGLQLVVLDDLRERLVTNEGGPPSDEDWCRSWEDFNFSHTGCESSLAAQKRICRAIRDVARRSKATTAVFTHGNVIALFLNALNSDFGRKDAERLMNPDVLRIESAGDAFAWDRTFRLAGLDAIATPHSQTPREAPGSQYALPAADRSKL